MQTVVSVFGVKPFRIGGTEAFARELSRQLNERGWRSVLCFLAEPTDDVRRFLALPNVTVEVLADSTTSGWRSSKNLLRLIRRYKPEILHLHFTGFVGTFPWLGRIAGVKKVFFTDHSSRPTNYKVERASFWKRAVVRLVNQPITKVVCVSAYGYQCLTDLNLLPNSTHELIYNAVDLSRVNNDARPAKEFRERYKIPEDKILVAQVSWMIPEKGVPALLKAASVAVTQNANVHFVLIGEGPHRQEFMQEAKALGLSNNVTWTGLIEDPFGEGAYAAADIVCQLSEWEELFGWMIAEAMAYGKPIVATAVGGIPELVKDEVSGFLIERGDIESAAKQINELARDPDLRHRLGDAGRKAVHERFDLKNNVSQLVRLYRLF